MVITRGQSRLRKKGRRGEDIDTETCMFMSLDLLIQVFVRLPFNSLFRFKAVCKRWNSFISSREFATLHQQHQHIKRNPLLHFFILSRQGQGPSNKALDISELTMDVDEVYKLDNWSSALHRTPLKLNPKFDVESYPIGSCNGLVCFMVGSNAKTLCLWNPATHDYYYIQGPRLSKHSIPLCWGFGYDPVSDDYKVLLLGELSGEPFAIIFTLRSNKWTPLECPSHEKMADFMLQKTPAAQLELNSLPVLAAHSLYWRIEDVLHPKHLLAFDLTTDLFQIISLPNADPASSHHICEDFFISQLGQCLCACWVWNESTRDDPRGPKVYIKVWMLEAHGDDKVWKPLFKLRGMERARETRLLPPLFQLKDYDKYLILLHGFRSFWVVDPRGEVCNPPKVVTLLTKTRPACYVFESTPTLASPAHHIIAKDSTWKLVKCKKLMAHRFKNQSRLGSS